MEEEQDFHRDLIRRRLELYPDVYALITDLSMRTRRIERGANEVISHGELGDFRDDYLEVNGRVGVLFSSHTSSASFNLRMFIFDTIGSSPVANRNAVLVSNPVAGPNRGQVEQLGDLIRRLEVALKQDLGVFREEFRIPRNNPNFNTYQELGRFRNR